MRVLARKLMDEPAAFIAAVAIVLTVVVDLLPVDGTAHAIVVAAIIAIGGQQTRARVSPVSRRP